MPISYVIHAEQGVVVTRFSGCVVDREFVDTYHRILADGEYSPGTHELADLRKIEKLDLSAGALQLVEEITEKRYAGTGATFRTAILAPRDHAFGIGRMYEMMAEDSPEKVLVCRDLQEARAWLGLADGALDL